MTEAQQLKLQALLDGELPENEAREAASWVARDAEATALLAELRNTRKALAGFEPGIKLPESREFYWSKIEREIRRLEPEPRVAESPALLRRLCRLLVPAGALAALMAIVTVAVVQSGVFGPSGGAETEMALAGSGTFTYHDYANGTTLVWLDFPAER